MFAHWDVEPETLFRQTQKKRKMKSEIFEWASKAIRFLHEVLPSLERIISKPKFQY